MGGGVILVSPAGDHSSHYSPAIEPYRIHGPELVVTPRQFVCPRCDSQLRMNYDEPQCLQCGYVDYEYAPPVDANKPKSILSAGTRYVLRYVGDFTSLNETLTYVQLRRVRNRVVFGVTCPFCQSQMDQSSLSGKRREVREERYKCTEGHRVSLTPAKNGGLGWK